MATLTGKPGIINETFAGGLLDIQLCGYGSRAPVAQGQGGETGVIVDVSLLNVAPTAPNNTFNIPLIGNDFIAPAGTYYTVTVKNNNGDIVQCNAYLFLDDNTYDLAAIVPFDPALPMPPLPPPITNQLQVINGGGDFVCAANAFLSFQLTLNQDATLEVDSTAQGNLYTFIIIQDGSGNHNLTWPSYFINASAINPAANGMTIQTFITDSNNNLNAVSAATWWTP